MYLVYITCKSEKEAKRVGKALLEQRLIGCANIIPSIKSLYWWKGKIVQEKEALLLCKTKKSKIPVIKKEVKKIHSYEIPCIEFFKVENQNKEYLAWLEKEL